MKAEPRVLPRRDAGPAPSSRGRLNYTCTYNATVGANGRIGSFTGSGICTDGVGRMGGIRKGAL